MTNKAQPTTGTGKARKSEKLHSPAVRMLSVRSKKYTFLLLSLGCSTMANQKSRSVATMKRFALDSV